MEAPQCKLCGKKHWGLCADMRVPFVEKIVTKSSTKGSKSAKKAGRPPIGDKAMSGAERVAAYRARKKGSA